MRERKKELVGRVVSDKMEKTVVVAVNTLHRHRLYHRATRRTKKYMAHDEESRCRIGDLVRIQESRPLSRHKHWQVIGVLEEAAKRGRAVELPVPAPTAGVPDLAEIASTDVVPGVLPGTAEADEDEPVEAEREGAST